MRIRFAFVVGMFATVVSGCFHGGYPYGNFGPGPSVLPPQPWTGNPYGPTYQPGYPNYPQGPIYQPGGTNPTPIGVPSDPNSTPGNGNSDPLPTYGPGGPGNAPGFDETPGTGRSVPNPDDGDLKRSTGANGLTPTSNAKSRSSGRDDLATPFEQDSTRRVPRIVAEESFAESDDFVSPIPQSVETDDDEIQQTGGTKTRGFAHHPRFEWVQGTVDYDEQTRSWFVMYDDNPKTSDPFGGELTLANDPKLSRQLRAGDVVRITGTVDDIAADSRGKPLYRATNIQK